MPTIIQPIRARANLLTKQWAANVRAVGGGFENNSLVIANGFANVLSRKSYCSKIKYLLPMLGIGINAARVPLIDVLRVGPASSTNFVDADFSQSTGLQGNGSSKYFDTLITPSQLGSSNNGGIGWWENNINFTGTGSEPIGCYDTAGTNRYVIDLRSSTAFFPWGAPGNNAGNGSNPATNGHFYGNRSSATSRAFYKNGSVTGTNTTNDTAAGASDKTILVCASNEPSVAYWAGRAALVYMTDGTMTDPEILDFDGVLRNYLVIPSGKP